VGQLNRKLREVGEVTDFVPDVHDFGLND